MGLPRLKRALPRSAARAGSGAARPLTLLLLASELAVPGCAADEAGERARVVPRDLTVTALPGGTGVLELSALTLLEGARGIELYAAVTNAGDRAACSAALSVELFDEAERSLSAGVGGLLTQQLYRVTDGSQSVAACIGRGEVGMASITDWSTEVALDGVRHVVYRCPYFALDVEPIDGIEIDELRSVAGNGETAYSGTLVNRLDVPVSNPSVTVFPINRAGRPLGAAVASEAIDVAPGESWRFETSSLDTAGVDQRAFPTGAIGTR